MKPVGTLSGDLFSVNTRVEIHPGDNRESLRRLIDEGVRVHSVVTDPPYGLVSVQKRFGKQGSAAARTEGNDGSFARLSGGFMGKVWDGTGIERDPEFWALIHEILLPGGFVFAFSGSRTGHWQACAMEMAGFIMHPMHGWVFGCLDTETLAATPDGDKPYTELSAGDEVICYDPTTGEYSVQPILEVVEYDYEDTAYRLIGDHGEQVVSRNHRCIVERGGSEVFHFAETLEQQEVVPVLEDLRGLREALRLQGSESDTKPSVFKSLQGGSALAGPRPNTPSARSTQGTNDHLPCMLNGSLEAGCLVAEDNRGLVLQSVLPSKSNSAEPTCSALAQRQGRLDEGQLGLVSLENDRLEQPGVERRRNSPQQEGKPRSAADQVCALSSASEHHVPQGRVCDGASDRGGESNGAGTAALGGGASHQPCRDGQPDHQPDAVREQCGSQTVRAWAGHKTDLVRVVPFHYVGKVWCLRVPTGAFVAVRNGVAFPTGNSGFPKAHNAAKAIDKHLKVEGSFAPEGAPVKRMIPGADQHATGSWEKNNGREYQPGSYVPGSDEAAQWEGWAYGTQTQKPALEPIFLGQKPFEAKTGAANLLMHGVGALNVDGCRVPTTDNLNGGAYAQSSAKDLDDATSFAMGAGAGDFVQPEGRHPANLILDGSPEVVAMFPDSKSSGSAARFFHRFPPDADPLFYHPKAGKADRSGSKHPTVKPIALMQYLIRHITPPGGVVLDPFAGSGTTAEAARREGFDCVLMEAEPEYLEFIKERFE